MSLSNNQLLPIGEKVRFKFSKDSDYIYGTIIGYINNSHMKIHSENKLIIVNLKFAKVELAKNEYDICNDLEEILEELKNISDIDVDIRFYECDTLEIQKLKLQLKDLFLKAKKDLLK